MVRDRYIVRRCHNGYMISHLHPSSGVFEDVILCRTRHTARYVCKCLNHPGTGEPERE